MIVILKEIVHLDLLNRVGLRFEEYFQSKALETQDPKKQVKNRDLYCQVKHHYNIRIYRS